MRKQQREPRTWTRKEYADIVKMKQQDKMKWPAIAEKVKDTVDNTIAAYRRAVGAKHGAYKNAAYSNDPAMHTALENPKIAVLDIETLPMIVYSWGLFDQNISIEQVISDSCMLSWAGKYLNSHEISSDVMTPQEAKQRDASRIAKSIWEFLSKADIVIGHNFAGFDVKFINTAFLKYDLPPLKYLIVDTFLIAKHTFRFSSNKMKYINGQLGIRNKIDNDGFPLWRACSDGDSEALRAMLEYNEGDIGATEELFYRLRPYIHNVNVALYNEMVTEQCPVCGGTKLHEEGLYHTPAGVWKSVRCESCKCLSRKKENLLSVSKRKSLLVNS